MIRNFVLGLSVVVLGVGAVVGEAKAQSVSVETFHNYVYDNLRYDGYGTIAETYASDTEMRAQALSAGYEVCGFLDRGYSAGDISSLVVRAARDLNDTEWQFFTRYMTSIRFGAVRSLCPQNYEAFHGTPYRGTSY